MESLSTAVHSPLDRRDRRDVPESAAPYTKEKRDLLARNRSGRWPRKKGGGGGTFPAPPPVRLRPHRPRNPSLRKKRQVHVKSVLQRTALTKVPLRKREGMRHPPSRAWARKGAGLRRELSNQSGAPKGTKNRTKSSRSVRSRKTPLPDGPDPRNSFVPHARTTPEGSPHEWQLLKR